MRSVHVFFNTVEKVQAFVGDITKFENDFYLVSDRCIVNAKSIMGIFCLDLTSPICLKINTEENTDAIMDVLSDYVV